jgi:hypothetical protein
MARRKKEEQSCPVRRKKESLAQVAVRFQRAIRDRSTSFLRLAWELRSIVQHWDSHYKEEAGGISVRSWIQESLIRDYSYWHERWSAVAAMGTEIISFMDHDAASYLWRQVPQESLPYFVGQAARYKRHHKGVPMSHGQMVALHHRVMGRSRKPQILEPPEPCPVCEHLWMRIEVLEACLRLHSIKIPEWPDRPAAETGAKSHSA